ncbi:hypothetical protein HOP62_09090 [Halomonas sp. MCCC 1A17488]|uniref:SOS response-associated peptidase family protein n=1 Tax=unclassified Halomonas TaxID=2609666 RepID=UPI0018D23DC2|nr:hypothetical protein [Halomonas sp. MCCC 1A17488]MCG3239564.1 hypothetical protein [Halomonas sp. MCCC 1A17488]QPP50518.1 SOS response-associated peptidase family protein [Halomonas sp. SS10-MC5]
MCGRFASKNAYPRLAKRLRVVMKESPPPRYNIAPGTWISGFRQTFHDRSPEQLNFLWGYRPKWASLLVEITLAMTRYSAWPAA